MKKAAFALIISLQIVSASGCIYSNNYDENGQEMNEEQVKEAIDDIKESVAGQIGSAVSEQNTGTDKNTTGNGGEADNTTNSDKEAFVHKIDEIIHEIGLENAVDYTEKIEDIAYNQIVFLCKSPSGHYEAYGLISPEYGMQGILINNIIDHESNYNLFCKNWAYSTERPTLNESDDYYHVIFRFCQDELGEMEEIHFETYDTGTMAADGWEKCSSIDVVHSLLLSSTPLCPSKDS